MAEATLGDLIKEVRQTNKSQEETTGAIQALTKVFAKQFTAQKYGAGDKLEDKIEGKKTGGGITSAGVAQAIELPGGNMFGGIFATIKQLAALATGFAASVAAVAAAFAGFRGWELGVLKNLDTIKTKLIGLIPEGITTKIGDAMDTLRTSVAKFFGIDPMNGKLLANGSRIGPNGFLPKVEYAKSFPQIIGEAFDNFRNSILEKFGIGADGKLLALTGDAAEDASPLARTVGKAIIQLKSFFRPFTKASEAMGKLFTSDIFKNITSLFGAAGGGFLKVANKILWPIGFIFSLWKGITEYQASDADGFIAKLGDGVGGFLGDFIGAPFDLLKRGVAWIIKKLFGVEVNADGTVPEGQGLPGWIVKQLNSFSFEETISSIVSGLFGVVQGAVDWVKLLFTDPKEAIEKLWITYIGVWNGFGDFIYTKLVKPAVEWVTGLFGWDNTDLPTWDGLKSIATDLFNTAKTWITSKFQFATENLPTWDGFTSIVTGLYESGKEWIISKFQWVSEKLPTWEGLKSIASEAFYSVRDWVKGKFTGGFEELKDLSTGLGDIIKAVGDNISLIKDILAAEVTYQITRVVNGFKIAFEKISTFIANLGDNLYIMLSESLQFNFPGISGKIPDFLPNWMGGGKFVEVMPAFSLGMGDDASRAQASSRIAQRNQTRDSNIQGYESETGAALANVTELQRQLATNMAPVVINQVDNSNNSTNTSTSSNVSNSGAPTDRSAPLYDSVF